MKKEDLETLNSKELKNVQESLNNKLLELQEKEEKIKDLQVFVELLIQEKKKEEFIENISNIAKKNEERAIELFGGKKYIFNFGGFRYIPIKKCLNKKQLDVVQYEMHNGVGIVNKHYLYEKYKENKSICFSKLVPEYEHSIFYQKSTLKKVDLFYCLENGFIFIPCNYELMHVENETLKKLGLYEPYSEVLENNVVFSFNI